MPMDVHSPTPACDGGLNDDTLMVFSTCRESTEQEPLTSRCDQRYVEGQRLPPLGAPAEYSRKGASGFGLQTYPRV